MPRSTPTTNLPSFVRRYEESIAAGNGEATAEIAHEMDSRQAWDYLDRMKQTLTMLGINDLGARMENLSGGQRKRVALARVVIRQPDFLILDEPTNHLDIAMIEWLENYLRRSRMTLLMVTHDRYFLDRVCNRIIELDNRTAYIYDGNFRILPAPPCRTHRSHGRRTRQGAEHPSPRSRNGCAVSRKARAGKAKFRIDSFYDLKERSRMNLTEKNVELRAQSSYIGSKIFEATDISKRFGDKVILDGFTYTFARGEKLRTRRRERCRQVDIHKDAAKDLSR